MMKSVEFKEFIILLIFLSCFGNVERNAMYFGKIVSFITITYVIVINKSQKLLINVTPNDSKYHIYYFLQVS